MINLFKKKQWITNIYFKHIGDNKKFNSDLQKAGELIRRYRVLSADGCIEVFKDCGIHATKSLDELKAVPNDNNATYCLLPVCEK